MLCGISTAQSVAKSVTALTGKSPERIPIPDSLAVVREFVRNAKAIEDSLTRLYFARKEITTLKAQKREAEDGRDFLAVRYQACKLDAADLATQLYHTKDNLGRERQKRRWNQVQKWVMVGVTAGLGYLQLRPFLPP